MNVKRFFQNNWIHFLIIGLFFIITFVFFKPQFSGYGLKQHDIEQFAGMAHETNHFREKTGQEPLWTNSMFGGMPTAQISVFYDGNVFQSMTIGFIRFMGGPGAILLIHLIGFYILSLCLRLNPIVGFFGAIAVSFASYEVIILAAGHNSKAIAVAYMAPIIGAFLMAYRRNWKWGAILSALFMSFQLAANHLQVTYYMAILLLALGVYELVVNIKGQKIKPFLITSSALIGAYLLAFFINYGNIAITNEYAKHTIRGKNDITITPNGLPSKVQSEGLDKDYITRWSYGIGESFTLLSPYVKGSSTVQLSGSPFVDLAQNSDLSNEELKAAMDMPVYWGAQPMTSGPVYIGVIVIFLSLLGLVFLKDRSKWVFLGVAVLALMLSWGKNFMGLTDFFIDHIPGYNKFRTVTIILVIVELCLPLIAVLFLNQLIKERTQIKENLKPFYITTGVFFLLLLIIRFNGIGDNYTSNFDKEQLERYREGMAGQIKGMDPNVLLTQYNLDVRNSSQVDQFIDAQMQGVEKGFNAIKKVRKDIFNSSMNRSVLFFIFLTGLILLLFYTELKTTYIISGITILLMVELIPVASNYLNSEEFDNRSYKYWVDKAKIEYPQLPEAGDEQVLANELKENPSLSKFIFEAEQEGVKIASEKELTGIDKERVVGAKKFMALNDHTNYRVFDFGGAFNSARASYFHKSLGGYHGAKLRNIQNVFDFHLANSNNNVYNMLNVKYFIQKGQSRPNPTALGNAWLIKNVRGYDSPNDEIRALGTTFRVENANNGVLFVNGEKVSTNLVYGSEQMQYLVQGRDTLNIRLPNGLKEGMKALFVMDANGVTNLIPEITLEVDTANSFETLVNISVEKEFNPRVDVVLLNTEKTKLTSKSYSAEGEIKMKSYAPNKLIYDFESNEKQLAVFSEIYYPIGWKAFVDGKEQEILKVNYLLRGLELDKGKHTIEFKFDLPTYRKSNTLAAIGSVFIFLLIIFGFWSDRKKVNS